MQGTSKKNKHTLFIIYGIGISLFNFVVFWLYINVDTVISTFEVEEFGDPFYYYKKMFKDAILGEHIFYKGAFGHTMISIVINLIILPLAIVTAYAFYKRVYGERFYRVIFYLPSIIAITTLAMSFRELFVDLGPLYDPEVSGSYTLTGPIAKLMKLFGFSGDSNLTVTQEGFGYDNIWYLIIFFCVFVGLGTNVVLMCGAMMRIPVDVTEALRLEGCGFFRELRSVTLPMIMPTITTWMIMIVTSVFSFSITPMLVAGLDVEGAATTARTNTIPLIIYVETVAQKGDPNEAMKSAQALGVLFSLIMMPLVFLTRWICEKLTPDISY